MVRTTSALRAGTDHTPPACCRRTSLTAYGRQLPAPLFCIATMLLPKSSRCDSQRYRMFGATPWVVFPPVIIHVSLSSSVLSLSIVSVGTIPWYRCPPLLGPRGRSGQWDATPLLSTPSPLQLMVTSLACPISGITAHSS